LPFPSEWLTGIGKTASKQIFIVLRQDEDEKGVDDSARSSEK
jgi:hypothetical protein